VYSHHIDLEPDCVSSSVFLEQCLVSSTEGNPCPTPGPGEERTSSSFALLAELDQRLDSLNALPDGGSFSGIADALADPFATGTALYNRLMSISPYCSDSTLLSILDDNDTPLSRSQITDILVANAPLSELVLIAAGTWSGLATASLDALGLASLERTPIQKLEAQINQVNWQRDRVLLDISKEWLSTSQVDSAIGLLANENRASLIKFRSHLLATSGQPDSAIQTLQRGLKLDEPENQAYLDYMQFRLDTASTAMDSLDEASIGFLRSIGSKEHQAGVWALNLLERATGERFEEEFDPIIEDDRYALPELARQEESTPAALRLFPNPAGEMVYVLGEFQSSEQGVVELMGMQGERLASKPISAGELIYFDLTNLPTGMYTVRLLGNLPNHALRFVHQR
jgi:hypothetical protein